MAMREQDLCPCQSGASSAECCAPLVSGERPALTAAALMRSRYTAYVLRAIAYLLATWHPSTRPVAIDPATIPEWCGLRIIHTERGGEADLDGLVEFEATALAGAGVCRLHERSRFVREAGQWFYRDGDLLAETAPGERKGGKVGRNDPCPCGSGKKYKRCCAPTLGRAGRGADRG